MGGRRGWWPTTASAAGFTCSPPSRRAGDRRRRSRLPDHQQQLGGHRRRARAGLPGRRRADRHGVHPVPPHRHGVAAEREGHLVTEGVRGEGGVLKNSEAAGSCSTTSRQLQAADRLRPGRGLALHARRQVGAPAARAAERDHVARGINREVKAGRGQPCTAASSSTSPGSPRSVPTRRSTSSGSCRACTTSSRSWPIST